MQWTWVWILGCVLVEAVNIAVWPKASRSAHRIVFCREDNIAKKRNEHTIKNARRRVEEEAAWLIKMCYHVGGCCSLPDE